MRGTIKKGCSGEGTNFCSSITNRYSTPRHFVKIYPFETQGVLASFRKIWALVLVIAYRYTLCPRSLLLIVKPLPCLATLATIPIVRRSVYGFCGLRGSEVRLSRKKLCQYHYRLLVLAGEESRDGKSEKQQRQTGIKAQSAFKHGGRLDVCSLVNVEQAKVHGVRQILRCTCKRV